MPHGCKGTKGGKEAAGLSDGKTYVDWLKPQAGGHAGGGQGNPFNRHEGDGNTGAVAAMTTLDEAKSARRAIGTLRCADIGGLVPTQAPATLAQISKPEKKKERRRTGVRAFVD